MHAIFSCNNAVLSVLCSFHKTVKPESVDTCWKRLAKLICWVKKAVDPKRCDVFLRTHILYPHVDVQLLQTKNARALQRLVLSFPKQQSNSYPGVFFSIPPDPAEQHVLPAFVFKLLPNPCNPLFAHENVPRMGVSPHAGFSTEQNPLRRSFVQPATWTSNCFGRKIE